MKASEMRSKSKQELEEELLTLRKEHFNLRLQRATGQMTRPHEYGRVRKNIARVKTVITEIENQGEGK